MTAIALTTLTGKCAALGLRLAKKRTDTRQ